MHRDLSSIVVYMGAKDDSVCVFKGFVCVNWIM